LRSDLKRFLFCIIVASFGAALSAAPASAPDSIVENYWVASQQQEHALEGASMEVDIQASLPKLKKQGRLHALRHISRLGRITYDALRFEGDNTVKKHVIARYLSADADAQSKGSSSLAVTPVNYKFKYKGLRDNGSDPVYVFEVKPRHKVVGLFKGEIWIDARTFLRVRESGRLVKSPSFFLKKIEFVKYYDLQDGISVPREIRTIVYTRLVGPAEMTIDFHNVSLPESPKRASVVDVDAQ